MSLLLKAIWNNCCAAAGLIAVACVNAVLQRYVLVAIPGAESFSLLTGWAIGLPVIVLTSR